MSEDRHANKQAKEQHATDEPAKSKSERKREIEALTSLGSRLIEIPDIFLSKLTDQGLIDAVRHARGINRGRARQRQVRYIGKLMRGTDVEAVRNLLDDLDSSSRRHTQQFHKLEQWRNGLLGENHETLNEILTEFPQLDRQYLRQLTKAAIAERDRPGSDIRHFRRLFRFLKDQT